MRQTAPTGERRHIQDVTLDVAIALQARPNGDNLADVSRRHGQAAIAARHQRRRLRRRQHRQCGEQVWRIQPVNYALVARADPRNAFRVDGDGVDHRRVAREDPQRRAIGIDSIHLAASGNRAGRSARGRRRHWWPQARRRQRPCSGCGGRRRRRRRLSAHARHVNLVIRAHRQRRNLSLLALVDHKTRPIRRDAQHQSGRLGAGNHVALAVNGDRARMRLIALKEQLAATARLHAMDLPLVTRGQKQVTLPVESHAPHVSLFRVIKHHRLTGRNLIYFAVG